MTEEHLEECRTKLSFEAYHQVMELVRKRDLDMDRAQALGRARMALSKIGEHLGFTTSYIEQTVQGDPMVFAEKVVDELDNQSETARGEHQDLLSRMDS